MSKRFKSYSKKITKRLDGFAGLIATCNVTPSLGDGGKLGAILVDCHLTLSFLSGLRPVTYHSNMWNGMPIEVWERYLTKITLIEEMFTQAKEHLDNDASGAFLVQNFLNGNNPEHTPMSGTLFIHIDANKTGVVVDMADCHVKQRVVLPAAHFKSIVGHLKAIIGKVRSQDDAIRDAINKLLPDLVIEEE